MKNDPFRGVREDASQHSDDELLKALANWSPGSEPYLIVQREIDRRKEASRDAREDGRFSKTEFRSWVAVGLSVLALAVALGAALYK